MALLALLLYLAVVIPLLFMVLSWHFTGNPMRCWQMHQDEMMQLFWIVLVFAVALPFMIAGTVYTLYAPIQYMMLAMNPHVCDDACVSMMRVRLFLLVFSIPSAVVGSYWVYRKWIILRQFFGVTRPDFVNHDNS